MSKHTVILGLGNLLYADEGIGVRAAEALFTDYTFPDHVEVVDGGTQGIALLDFVDRAERLVILDAVDFGLEPGAMVRKTDAEVPRYLTAQKTSVHQNSLSEVLALSTLRDTFPEALVLIGMQPVDLTMGRSLSEQGRTVGLPEMVRLTLDTLDRWGIHPTPASETRNFNDPSLRMETFEQN